MRHLGNYDTASVIYGKFTSYQPSTGAAFALAGSPALAVYKDGSTTESTAGVTLTASFDSRTGLNHYAIDTSADGTFYSAGSFFDIVLTAGTVDGVSVAGASIASFTLAKSAAVALATDVWDEVLSGHTTSGTTGAALNAASSAGDPWATALPGAYGTGSAGKIVGDNLNAKVGDVKAKTDNLPSAAAGATGGLPTVDSANSVKIQAPAKKNVARNNFTFFMFDSTTGAPATGLTVTATRSIDGAAPASCTNSPSEVTSGAGRYKINLSAADLNGDVIAFKFSATGAKDTTHTLMPLP